MREDKIMVVKAISVQDLKLPPNHVHEFIGTSLLKSSTSTFDTRRCTAHVAISSWSDAENIIKTIALETQREAPLMSEAFVRCRHIFVQVIFLNDKWSEDDYMEIADWFLEEELKKLKRLQSFVCLLLSIFFLSRRLGEDGMYAAQRFWNEDVDAILHENYLSRLVTRACNCLTVWHRETYYVNNNLYYLLSFPNQTHPPDFRLKLWGTNELTRQRLGFENNYLSKQISKRQP